MANPYETLGVAPNASQDDIRKAYRKAAKESHPDLNPGKPEAEKRFKEINAANDIIGDADKRKLYDAGEIDESGAERQSERHYYREYAEADPGPRYSPRGAPGGGQGNGAGGFGYDIFADLFRGRGGEGGGFRMPPQMCGTALRSTFSMRQTAATKWCRCQMARHSTSPFRPGSTTDRCSASRGRACRAPTANRGDAYVQISIRPHPGFKREGDNILNTLPVSLGEALNGASVRVETVDGPVEVKIPKGAREGAKLRLRGKGASRGKDGGRGDQVVEIHIVPPEGADDALAQFMAEWEKTHPQNPRKKGAA